MTSRCTSRIAIEVAVAGRDFSYDLKNISRALPTNHSIYQDSHIGKEAVFTLARVTPMAIVNDYGHKATMKTSDVSISANFVAVLCFERHKTKIVGFKGRDVRESAWNNHRPGIINSGFGLLLPDITQLVGKLWMGGWISNTAL